MRERENYDPPQSGKLTNLLTAILLFAVALLLLYIITVPQEPFTPATAILDALHGLAGKFTWVLPLALLWFGVHIAMKMSGRPYPALHWVSDLLLWLLILTAAELFAAASVMAKLTVQNDYFNFIANAYVCGEGGGALGALLAYPIYTYLGVAIGIAVLLIVAALLLAATGRIQRLAERIKERSSDNIFRVKEERRIPERRRVSEEPIEPRRTATRPRRDPMSDNLRSNIGAMPNRPAQPRARAKAVDVEEMERVAKRTAPERARPVKRDNSNPRGTNSTETKEGEDMFDFNLKDKTRKAARPTPDEPLSPKRDSRADDFAFEGAGANAPFDDMDAPFNPRSKKKKSDFEDESFHADRSHSQKTSEPKAKKPAPKDEPPFDVPKPKKTFEKMARPQPVPEDECGYNYPPIDLLQADSGVTENYDEHDREIAETLIDTLEEFGIECSLVGIAHGPAVTRFELNPARGIKLSRITSLSDDIAMRLAAISVRIEAPIPGKAAVGVEIPNRKVETVHLRDVLESQNARKMTSKVAVGLGKDNGGNYILADIAKMPHVLIAGQTGSGKSVCINSIIASILYRATPEEVRLILIDPKVVELSIYNDIPHLVCPVVTDPKKAASALDWAVAEMSTRYKRFAERGVRDIKGYNKALQKDEAPMPQMVIVIDELADLMMVAPGEVEDSICRLAQLARAAGMHLVIATQRPSVNVITGTIKANIPTRIAFSVASQIDSRTMIDHGGAEKLLGNGDMLYVPSGINKPMRVQGSWVSDEEIHAVVSYIKQNSETTYDQDMIEQIENAVKSDAEKEEANSEYDPRLPEAVEIVVEAGQASVSMLQRRMRVGYARAGRLIDEMEQRGIVSEADGAKPRTVLITRDDMNLLFEDAPAAEE